MGTGIKESEAVTTAIVQCCVGQSRCLDSTSELQETRENMWSKGAGVMALQVDSGLVIRDK